MLEVLAGLLFTFLLLSLLGTTLNELIAAWRGWRGFYLEEALKRLLEFKDNPAVYEKFKNNAFYRQLMQHKAPLRVSQAPAYLSASNFTSILMNVLKGKGKTVEKIEDYLADLPEDSQLRQVLEQLKEEGHESVEAYKARLQSWFDDVMWQASGWYKRHVQFVTLFVGLSIAGALNADSFQIYRHLNTNTAARQKLSVLAEKFVQNNPALPAPVVPSDSLTLNEIKNEVGKFIQGEDFKKTSNILGLGWKKEDLTVGFTDWVYRIFGWLVTAFAISLGAPFWFDILKKVVTISSSGGTASDGGTPQVVINTGKDVETKK
ncbi:MAG: hypothetical protein ACE5FF_07215 [Saprospiraceae bacterium]